MRLAMKDGNGSHEKRHVSVWETVKGNKLFTGIVLLLISSIVSWGCWATCSIFECQAMSQNEAIIDQHIVESIDKQNGEIVDIKLKLDRIQETQKEDLMRIMGILLEIKNGVNGDEESPPWIFGDPRDTE